MQYDPADHFGFQAEMVRYFRGNACDPAVEAAVRNEVAGISEQIPERRAVRGFLYGLNGLAYRRIRIRIVQAHTQAGDFVWL